jgi:hypothetical protein
MELDPTFEDKIIYRSVSAPDVIIPYDENGDALRLAIQGDRPSAFRAVFFLLFAMVGINLMSLAGYMQGGARSIIVSRNQSSRTSAVEAEPSSTQEPVQLTRSESPILRERTTSAEAEERPVKEQETLDEVTFVPCPPPYGKVIYVNSEEKNINVKSVRIKDPQKMVPSKSESKGEKTVKRSKSKAEAKPASLEGELPEKEKVKKSRDTKILQGQMRSGGFIPPLRVLKEKQIEMDCISQISREFVFDVLSIALPGKGGKTRKYKKPLKKKSNTRNKNKTKKTKNSKKTIKRRNKILQKKHRKTR